MKRGGRNSRKKRRVLRKKGGMIDKGLSYMKKKGKALKKTLKTFTPGENICAKKYKDGLEASWQRPDIMWRPAPGRPAVKILDFSAVSPFQERCNEKKNTFGAQCYYDKIQDTCLNMKRGKNESRLNEKSLGLIAPAVVASSLGSGGLAVVPAVTAAAGAVALGAGYQQVERWGNRQALGNERARQEEIVKLMDKPDENSDWVMIYTIDKRKDPQNNLKRVYFKKISAGDDAKPVLDFPKSIRLAERTEPDMMDEALGAAK
jgi:hypothetical protein